jgi:hypothetical protein
LPGDPTSAARFGLVPGVLVRHWEDGPAVVYAGTTATTHLVGAGAAAILTGILNSPEGVDAQALARSIEGGDEPADADTLNAIHGLLNGLVQSGLLRRLT